MSENERPVLAQFEMAWEKIGSSPGKIGPRMKDALRLVACGDSYREAAKAVGFSSHGEVFETAKRFGMTASSTTRVVQRIQEVANLSLAELERRLHEDPEQFPSKDLAVIAGITTDKLAKKERWGAAGERPEGDRSALEQLADAASRGLISMDIQVRPKEEKDSDSKGPSD
jgi:hypothetical protein